MARLGKREREAKRAIIRANLTSPREVTERRVIRDKAGSLRVIEVHASVNHADTLKRGTHTMGFRAPQQKVRRLDA